MAPHRYYCREWKRNCYIFEYNVILSIDYFPWHCFFFVLLLLLLSFLTVFSISLAPFAFSCEWKSTRMKYPNFLLLNMIRCIIWLSANVFILPFSVSAYYNNFPFVPLIHLLPLAWFFIKSLFYINLDGTDFKRQWNAIKTDEEYFSDNLFVVYFNKWTMLRNKRWNNLFFVWTG